MADFTGLTDYYFRNGYICCIQMPEPMEIARYIYWIWMSGQKRCADVDQMGD